MVSPNIVIVDDDLLMLEMCKDILEANDFHCRTVVDSRRAMEVIAQDKPDLVITDLQMPHVTGMDLLKAIKEFQADLPVIILTGHGTIESAVQAVQLGAHDYVPKPFKPDELCHRIRQALQNTQLTRENKDLKRKLAKSRQATDIVGNSRAMKQVFSTIERAAPTGANVMIHGESGTGKEMVARAIHRQSHRADHPFVPVDCVAIPDQLIESELFGHVKGSFTGATDDKVGLFEMANGGTIFLDEITEMNIDLQGKLLRVLQERKFRRVGGREFHDLNIRLIAATNRDPEKAIDSGHLRLDLFYRLNVIPIELPPLRARQDDVIQLLDHFLNRFSETNSKAVKTISHDAMDSLLAYDWPGNVRELQNLVERLVILAVGDRITLDDLPKNVLKTNGNGSSSFTAAATPVNETSFEEHLFELHFKDAKKILAERFEKQYLGQLLTSHDGNISRAARAAGIDRKTIHRLVKAHGIEIDELVSD